MHRRRDTLFFLIICALSSPDEGGQTAG